MKQIRLAHRPIPGHVGDLAGGLLRRRRRRPRQVAHHPGLEVEEPRLQHSPHWQMALGSWYIFGYYFNPICSLIISVTKYL